MAYYKFIAKLSQSSIQLLQKAYHFLNAVMTGFWLGTMSEKSLDYSDELHYSQSNKYKDDDYTSSGLFEWEKARIEKYFSNAKSILLIGAGGGREVLALSKMGFDVYGYECNQVLVDYANLLLQRNQISNKIKYLPRNTVPAEIKKYDGIIIGWGAYSHIRGKRQRLSFLADIYPLLQEEAPLMISFLRTWERTRQEKIIRNVSNFFKIFSNKDKTELGDGLMLEFVHFFNEEEIKGELVQSKFRIKDYYNIDYGCIIASV